MQCRLNADDFKAIGNAFAVLSNPEK